ncbi:MAG TPA: hypothetical protein VMZ49_02190 [Patescibacteria group bacterium]|nr:hypothetical protein [Patescibacteria group bacterium]
MGSSERLTGLDRAETGQTPHFREAEQEKQVGKAARKFPWLLVGGIVAGAAAGAFLIFTVFKKKDYDIRGTWDMDLYLTEEPLRTLRIYFKGSKTKGEYNGAGHGSYSVEGKKVRFGNFTHATNLNFTGEFDSRETMSGSYSLDSAWVPAKTGAWWARKISSNTGAE